MWLVGSLSFRKKEQIDDRWKLSTVYIKHTGRGTGNSKGVMWFKFTADGSLADWWAVPTMAGLVQVDTSVARPWHVRPLSWDRTTPACLYLRVAGLHQRIIILPLECQTVASSIISSILPHCRKFVYDLFCVESSGHTDTWTDWISVSMKSNTS